MPAKRSQRLWRMVAAAGLLICLVVLLLVLYVLLDLRAFEIPYLLSLLGWKGVGVALVSLGTLLWITYTLIASIRSPEHFGLSPAKLILISALGLFYLWIAEWLFMERPITVRLYDSLASTSTSLKEAEQSLKPGEQAPIADVLSATSDESTSLHIMAARIIANRPDRYSYSAIAGAIGEASQLADVDPVPLFYWLYQTSFYGEAVSGPLPFTAGLTAETFRDLVQVHLPWWFIENPLRLELINDDLLERLFGHTLGWKLRYALHKANLDVSSDPFGSNTFSDVFYIMSKYPKYFAPDLSASSDPLDVNLGSSFKRLRAGLSLDACALTPTNSDFEAYRDEFATFARAAYLKMLFDLPFAARVQALVLKDSLILFEKSAPDDVWPEVSHQQKLGLVVMWRDVYTPNVGSTSPIPYILPELNCEPRSYLASEIKNSGTALLREDRFWRPSHPDYLWAGPGYILRIFSEVWQASYGRPIKNVAPTQTTQQAIPVVLRGPR
jgi:hypothetical protein